MAKNKTTRQYGTTELKRKTQPFLKKLVAL